VQERRVERTVGIVHWTHLLPRPSPIIVWGTYLTEETFRWVRNELGRHDLEDLQDIHHAIVHRYVVDNEADGSPADVESEKLVRNVVACLRLVRPMRQRTGLLRGVLLQDGTIDVRHFEHPRSILEVPEVQKLFHLRNADLESLKAIAGEFLRAMGGDFWKFRMAVEFHEAGHFQDWYWKARYSLWCSELVLSEETPRRKIEMLTLPRRTDRIELPKLDLDFAIDSLPCRRSSPEDEINLIYVEESAVRIPSLLKELKLGIRLP
jgi:hypothetical protein